MTKHRGRTVSIAEFSRLWASDMTEAQIGALLGITQAAVQMRAKARGLPRRKDGPPRIITDTATFRSMWTAGVMIDAMATHFGVAERTIRTTVERLGLEKRGRNRHRSITIFEWRERRLAEALAASAARTRDVMALADMADGIEARRLLHRRAA